MAIFTVGELLDVKTKEAREAGNCGWSWINKRGQICICDQQLNHHTHVAFGGVSRATREGFRMELWSPDDPMYSFDIIEIRNTHE